MRYNLLAGALCLALLSPVYAQSYCVTVEEDKAKSEAYGLHWLGERRLPFSNDTAVFYEAGGRVVFSLVADGCVSPDVYPLWVQYVEEKNA